MLQIFRYDEDPETAISFGAILRDCMRHQVVAKYLLESDHMKAFFKYQHDPNFDISSDAAAIFKVKYLKKCTFSIFIRWYHRVNC